MNSSLFCVLPLPLSQPLLFARLAGLGVLHIDPQGQQVERTLHLSKVAPHTLLSPVYLFKQNIDPYKLEHGLTGLKFYQACRKSLTVQSSDDILVTFAMRHMMILNSLALQNMQIPNVLRSFNRGVDLKTALATCSFFGEKQIPLLKNLDEAAAFLKYPYKLDNQLSRLDALMFVYSYLMEHEPKIMAFLLRSKQEVVNSLLNAQHPYFVHINDQGKLCVMKFLCMSPDQVYVKALASYGSNLEAVVLNLDLMPLIAPLAILTPERQQKMKLSLDEHLQRLEQANLNDLLPNSMTSLHSQKQNYRSLPTDEQLVENSNATGQMYAWQDIDRNFYDRQLFAMTQAQLQILQRQVGTPLSDDEFQASFNADKTWLRLAFYYQYENFPQLRTSRMDELYRIIVNEQIRSRTKQIIQESQMLLNNQASFTQEQLTRLQNLLKYFTID